MTIGFFLLNITNNNITKFFLLLTYIMCLLCCLSERRERKIHQKPQQAGEAKLNKEILEVLMERGPRSTSARMSLAPKRLHNCGRFVFLGHGGRTGAQIRQAQKHSQRGLRLCTLKGL